MLMSVDKTRAKRVRFYELKIAEAELSEKSWRCADMSTLRPSKLVDSVGYSPVSFQRNLHLRKAVLRGTKVPFTSERVLQFSLGIRKNETWATL